MGKLFIIPTPIGNLEDITLRALRILKEVDCILCEDTRTSSKLLNHYGIEKPLRSYHMHNEHNIMPSIVTELQGSTRQIALISDAGTPAISDPGFLLTRSCIEAGLEVECLPGATALIPALVNSGFPCNEFTFVGFLPAKKGRQKLLKKIQTEERTLVFYESPYRVLRTLSDLKEYFGESRLVSISREITKIHEQNIRGTLSEVENYFKENPPKGEFVIILKSFQ